MKLPTVKPVILCLLLVLPLICGLGTGCSEAEKPIPSACDLISKEQVSKIVGQEFTEAKEIKRDRKGDVSYSVCTFSGSSDQSVGSVTVMEVFDPAIVDPKTSAQDHIKYFRESLGEPNYAFEAIDNVGGAAVYDGAIKQLAVFEKGRKLFFQGNGKDPKKQLIELAVAITAK